MCKGLKGICLEIQKSSYDENEAAWQELLVVIAPGWSEHHIFLLLEIKLLCCFAFQDSYRSFTGREKYSRPTWIDENVQDVEVVRSLGLENNNCGM